MTSLPSTPATDAELLAAVHRGIQAGTFIEVTPEYLARMAAELDAAPSAPVTCDGTEVIPTEDGPWVTGCTRRGCACKGRQQTAARIARTGDVFLGAVTADDEEW